MKEHSRRSFSFWLACNFYFRDFLTFFSIPTKNYAPALLHWKSPSTYLTRKIWSLQPQYSIMTIKQRSVFLFLCTNLFTKVTIVVLNCSSITITKLQNTHRIFYQFSVFGKFHGMHQPLLIRIFISDRMHVVWCFNVKAFSSPCKRCLEHEIPDQD